MFTGIVQTTGTIESDKRHAKGKTFMVSAPALAARLSPGDSIAVNGVCQTVETVAGAAFAFTAVGETLKRTTFDALEAGHPEVMLPIIFYNLVQHYSSKI